jgi:hypothetical protein
VAPFSPTTSTKTWPEFKTHFRTAQKAIKRSQPLTTTDTLGYHREANAVKEGDDAIGRISLPSNNCDELTVAETAAAELADQQLLIHLANIASSAHQNQTMMAQMQTLMSTISDLQSEVQQNSGNNGNRNDSGSNNSRRGRGHGQQGRNNHQVGNQQAGSQQGGRPQQPRKYCWMHGLCAHDSPSYTAQTILPPPPSQTALTTITQRPDPPSKSPPAHTWSRPYARLSP